MRIWKGTVSRAIDLAAHSADVICSKSNLDPIACNVGRVITLQALERFREAESTKELRSAMRAAESEGRIACQEYDGKTRAACAAGRIATIGVFRNEISKAAKIELTGVPAPPSLGIFVSPDDPCPRGFERIHVKGGRNKKVHVCRLDEEHRKKSAPKGKPARKGPLRRKNVFGPGVEADHIRTVHEHRVRKSAKRLIRD